MNAKFITAIALVATTISVLIYFAASSTAKEVVRVQDLVESGRAWGPVQLGARVGEAKIVYRAQPERTVSFHVRDPVTAEGQPEIEVVYYGALPDTLRSGRDVILQGEYDGKKFIASSLLTQCPSKYVPPTPEGTKPADGTAPSSEQKNY